MFTKLFKKLISEPTNNQSAPPYYTNWQTAQKQCDGYATPAILESVVKASKAVSKGDALYERDGVTFRHFAENAHLVLALRHVLKAEGHFQVLDFGGSLGSIYRQHRWFLSEFTHFTWCVVEQKHFAETGKQMFQNNKLKFEETIGDAVALYKPNIAVLSNVLQRIEQPFDVLNDLVQSNIPYLFIDRTPVIDSAENRITRSIFPAKKAQASYPSWVFAESAFKEKLQQHYRIINEFDDTGTTINGTRHVGFFCERI